MDDQLVSIEKSARSSLGQEPSNGGLSRAHHSDQNPSACHAYVERQRRTVVRRCRCVSIVGCLAAAAAETTGIVFDDCGGHEDDELGVVSLASGGSEELAYDRKVSQNGEPCFGAGVGFSGHAAKGDRFAVLDAGYHANGLRKDVRNFLAVRTAPNLPKVLDRNVQEHGDVAVIVDARRNG